MKRMGHCQLWNQFCSLGATLLNGTWTLYSHKCVFLMEMIQVRVGFASDAVAQPEKNKHVNILHVKCIFFFIIVYSGWKQSEFQWVSWLHLPVCLSSTGMDKLNAGGEPRFFINTTQRPHKTTHFRTICREKNASLDLDNICAKYMLLIYFFILHFSKHV